MSGNSVIFEERQGVELVSFVQGLTVAGKLLSVEPKTIEYELQGKKAKKQITCYTIEERDGAGYTEATGKLYQFPAYADVKEKIRTSDVGKLVIVTMTGENAEMGKNGNSMKTFEVKVSKGRAPVAGAAAAASLEITDEDIPF